MREESGYMRKERLKEMMMMTRVKVTDKKWISYLAGERKVLVLLLSCIILWDDDDITVCRLCFFCYVVDI